MTRPEQLPPIHRGYLEAAVLNLQGAQALMQFVQAQIQKDLGLPDGTQITPDGRILYPEGGQCPFTISDARAATSPSDGKAPQPEISSAPPAGNGRRGSSP